MVIPSSFLRADIVSEEKQLPHFFKNKLRLAAYRGTNDELLKTYAEIFAVSVLIARNCRYNTEEIHEYTVRDPDAQIRRFPFLAERAGHMPNPVWRYAESYAHYKNHHKEKNEIEKIRAKQNPVLQTKKS